MRPFKGNDCDFKYMLDDRYCSERSSLCRAYRIIQDDLEKLFDYIEPCENNKNAYSHRTFELLLRGATEVEANCKGILKANGYRPGCTHMTMNDYYKIEQATKLSEYQVNLQCWHPRPLELKPFENWGATPSGITTSGSVGNHSLLWYQAYNAAKHNRDTNFHESNLLNVVNCIAGLLCLLYSQFEYQFVNPYQSTFTYTQDPETEMMSFNGVIFTIKPPKTWTDSEKYQFTWNSSSGSSSRCNQFTFL